MSSGALPPPPPNPPTPTPVLTGPGAYVAAGVGVMQDVSKWTSSQVVIVMAVLSGLVINGLLVWTMFNQRSDRADERKMQSDRESLLMRSIEDGREKDRGAIAVLAKDVLNHCKESQRSIMDIHQAERDMDRKYYGDVQERHTTAIMNLVAAVDRVVKKVTEEIPVALPRAPMPRCKLLGRNDAVIDLECPLIPRTTVPAIPSIPPARPN